MEFSLDSFTSSTAGRRVGVTVSFSFSMAGSDGFVSLTIGSWVFVSAATGLGGLGASTTTGSEGLGELVTAGFGGLGESATTELDGLGVLATTGASATTGSS